jgi:CBS domain containing-hemolysin-like protein
MLATPPKKEDWARLKPLIEVLYVHENKPLKEVMQIMEREHGHKAT